MRTVRRTAVAALVAATVTTGFAVPAQATPRPDRTFDLQAHRGGLGLRVENTLASFANALELGVSTLELDVQITEDGKAVVTHDRKITGTKCADTGPVHAGDPEYPYVGKYIKDLTGRRSGPWTAARRRCRSSPGSARPRRADAAAA